MYKCVLLITSIPEELPDSRFLNIPHIRRIRCNGVCNHIQWIPVILEKESSSFFLTIKMSTHRHVLLRKGNASWLRFPHCANLTRGHCGRHYRCQTWHHHPHGDKKMSEQSFHRAPSGRHRQAPWLRNPTGHPGAYIWFIVDPNAISPLRL